MSSSSTSAGSSSSPPSQQSWLNYLTQLATTQSGRLILTATASCAATAASIFSYQAAIRLAKRKDLARRVDKATHRDSFVEKSRSSHHGGAGAAGAEDDEESIDGGTPRYLDHLAHLTPSRSYGAHHNHGHGASSPAARAASPLRRQNSRTSLVPATMTSSSRSNAPYDESLVREQLSRNFSFVGDEAMKRLREAFIIVVGLGGVGSHVALSLIRSGVGHVRLIDFDQVSLSSLNRHAVANLDDVGRPKVIVCQEHFRRIAPWVQIQAWVDIFNESDADRLLSPFPASASKEIPPTYVIDCIDNLNTKVGLLAYCHHHNIKVFSSMGAGAKCDPTRICIGDLTDTEEDPLAKSVRRRLRERGIPRLEEKEKGKSAEVVMREKEERKERSRQSGPKGGRKDDSAGKAAQTTPKKGGLAPKSAQNTPRPPQKANNSDEQKPSLPLPPAPSTPQSSRRISESRRVSRASSMSSFGSGEGAFFTPEGTPREEEAEWSTDEQREQPPAFKLDEGSEGEETQDAKKRPDLEKLHRASSGLESLNASPVAEKSEGEVELLGPAEGGLSSGSASRGGSSGKSSRSQSPRRRQEVDGELLRPPASSRASSTDGNETITQSTVDVAPSSSSTPPLPTRSPQKAPSNSKSNRGPASSSSSGWTSHNPQYIIPCIFSTEKPSAKLVPLNESDVQGDGGIEMLRALEDGNDWRVRTLPVLGPLPAIFGLSIAAYVLCDVGGREELMMEPLAGKVKRKSAERALKELEGVERMCPSPASTSSTGTSDKKGAAKGSTLKRGTSSNSIASAASAGTSVTRAPGRSVPFLLDDVFYLIVEVFHSRSVVPPFHSISAASACLLRWDSTLPLSFGNVALFTKEQAKVHTDEVLKRGRSPVEVWGEEARRMWGKRMDEERWYARFR